MKVNKIIAAGVLSAVIGSSAFAQTVINLTGATAFRAASHAAIRATLDDTQFAWVGNQELSGADRAIFKGTINGEEYIIRTSWSGSGAGVAALLDQSNVEVLALNTPVSAAGGVVASPSFEQGVAKFAFSDVAQSATSRPTPSLQATPVGVVPFMFVASKSAVGTGFTNVTSQQFEAMYSIGFVPLSMFTGNASDERIVAPTGRASSSGTRITVLAETGFGINSNVSQWQVGGTGLITADDMEEFGPGAGYSSNSFIRTLVQRESGEGEPLVFGYLTVSDALAATANGNAQALSYNGVEYSVENVTSGKYTLWGYQQFFNVQGLSAPEVTFKDTLISNIAGNLGNAGISIPEMKVTRFGGEGGVILPN